MAYTHICRGRGEAQLQHTGVAVEPIPRSHGTVSETPLKEGAHLMTPVKLLLLVQVTENISIASSPPQNIKKVLIILGIVPTSPLAKP